MGARALVNFAQRQGEPEKQIRLQGRSGLAPSTEPGQARPQTKVSQLTSSPSDLADGSFDQSGKFTQNKEISSAGASSINCVQGVWNQAARDNITAARDILDQARNHYLAFDHTLDGNRINWGYSVNTWNTLLHNVTLKSNHMRGQGTADALESMSWGVSNNPRTVRGPGGGAGVDLRLFSAAGIGANRMDVEVKHAGSVASIRDQIDAAVIAHGRNQTIKVYVKNVADIPDYGAAWVRNGVTYTVRTVLNDADNNTVFVNFYQDTNPGVRIARKKVGWP
jgi:hypothetical protein